MLSIRSDKADDSAAQTSQYTENFHIASLERGTKWKYMLHLTFTHFLGHLHPGLFCSPTIYDKRNISVQTWSTFIYQYTLSIVCNFQERLRCKLKYKQEGNKLIDTIYSPLSFPCLFTECPIKSFCKWNYRDLSGTLGYVSTDLDTTKI